MYHLLLIDVAACAVLIMVAAFVMVRRWQRRTGRSLIPARGRRRAAADRAADGPAPSPAGAAIPGFSDDGSAPGPGLPTPLEADQAARAAQATDTDEAIGAPEAAPARQSADTEHATQPLPAVRAGHATHTEEAMLAPQAARTMQAGEPNRERRHDRGPRQDQGQRQDRDPRQDQGQRAGQAGQPQGRRAGGHPGSSLNGPGAAPQDQPRAAGAGSTSEQIGSYYDEADQAMSDYLAAMGWADEPEPHDPQ